MTDPEVKAALTDDKIISAVLVNEGPIYTDDPSDRGGPTKYGITLADLSKSRGRTCTAADVQSLTEAEARLIYRARYITQPSFDLIADPLLRAQLVDFGVTSGPERAVRWLQRMLELPATGKINVRMLDAIGKLPPRLVNNALVAARVYMDECIVDSDPTQKKWDHGWRMRALSFLLKD